MRNIIIKDHCESAKTELTMLEIYPHTNTWFHLLMGLIAIFVIVPLFNLISPVLILIKFVLCAPFLLVNRKKSTRNTFIREIIRIKNFVFMPFHYCVFKVYYTYIRIWMAYFHKQDDYWYGVDISPYANYEDYVTSFRDSRVRWRYKKKLRTYNESGILEKVIPDHLVFFNIFFLPGIFSLVKDSMLRKNSDMVNVKKRILGLMLRDYFLLLFLPVRLHIYEKDGRIVGLSSYLKKGNTLVMLQHIIADDFSRSCLFYKQMERCFSYAFGDPQIRYVSCGFTSAQSKQTCGCYPINYLLIDEYKFIPFSVFEVIQTKWTHRQARSIINHFFGGKRWGRNRGQGQT